MSTPEFLMKDVTPGPIEADTLEQLKAYVDLYKEQEAAIKEAEAMLKEMKKSFTKTSQEHIPELLLSHGLTDIKLVTGEKIEVTEGISVTVEDNDKFFQFLKERDEDDIIKMQVAFSRMESEAITALLAYLFEHDYDYEVKRDVAGQTKKKYFKELLGLGIDEDEYKEGIEAEKYMRQEDLKDFAKLFVYHTTKIK